jgi:hypothetical protein
LHAQFAIAWAQLQFELGALPSQKAETMRAVSALLARSAVGGSP